MAALPLALVSGLGVGSGLLAWRNRSRVQAEVDAATEESIRAHTQREVVMASALRDRSAILDEREKAARRVRNVTRALWTDRIERVEHDVEEFERDAAAAPGALATLHALTLMLQRLHAGDINAKHTIARQKLGAQAGGGPPPEPIPPPAKDTMYGVRVGTAILSLIFRKFIADQPPAAARDAAASVWWGVCELLPPQLQDRFYARVLSAALSPAGAQGGTGWSEGGDFVHPPTPPPGGVSSFRQLERLSKTASEALKLVAFDANPAKRIAAPPTPTPSARPSDLQGAPSSLHTATSSPDPTATSSLTTPVGMLSSSSLVSSPAGSDGGGSASSAGAMSTSLQHNPRIRLASRIAARLTVGNVPCPPWLASMVDSAKDELAAKDVQAGSVHGSGEGVRGSVAEGDGVGGEGAEGGGGSAVTSSTSASPKPQLFLPTAEAFHAVDDVAAALERAVGWVERLRRVEASYVATRVAVPLSLKEGIASLEAFACAARGVVDAQVAVDAFESVTLAHSLILSPPLPDSAGRSDALGGGAGEAGEKVSGKVTKVAQRLSEPKQARPTSILEKWWGRAAQ